MSEQPIEILKRKVIHLDPKLKTSPKVSIPRKWLKGAEYVNLEVYPDKLIIRKANEGNPAGDADE